MRSRILRRDQIRAVVGTATIALVLTTGARPAAAATTTQPRLGTALNFAVLAGSTITNTGPTVITGNLGLAPGTAVTGFPPGAVTGVQNKTDAVALQAKNDLVTAYTDAAAAPSTSDLTGQDLGGKSLVPGVYTFSSSAQLTGTLTLSGNGVFIFRIGSTLTTASSAAVLVSNGAQACAVYWQVGSSATLGSATQFQGNLMALTSITMTTGANILTGRALARNGALTLDTNHITPPAGTCTVAASTGTSTTAGPKAPNTGADVGFMLPAAGLVLTGSLLVAFGGTLGARRYDPHGPDRRRGSRGRMPSRARPDASDQEAVAPAPGD